MYNRGTDIGYAKYEVIDVDTGKVLESPEGFKIDGERIKAAGTSHANTWIDYVRMPNKEFHIQARTYHIDPATGDYLPNPDTIANFTINLSNLGKLNVNSTPSNVDCLLDGKLI